MFPEDLTDMNNLEESLSHMPWARPSCQGLGEVWAQTGETGLPSLQGPSHVHALTIALHIAFRNNTGFVRHSQCPTRKVSKPSAEMSWSRQSSVCLPLIQWVCFESPRGHKTDHDTPLPPLLFPPQCDVFIISFSSTCHLGNAGLWYLLKWEPKLYITNPHIPSFRAKLAHS